MSPDPTGNVILFGAGSPEAQDIRFRRAALGLRFRDETHRPQITDDKRYEVVRPNTPRELGI